jgi:lipoyl(octanoyl) transferase
MKPWRLLSYGEFAAAENMALDESILDAHIRGDVFPTLRFYGFAPPAVSIGYNQQLPEAVRSNIAQAGFDLVRRPTGGRAVLHIHDLTYSFVCSSGNEQPLDSSVLRAYKQICSALQAGFRRLGISVELGESDRAYRMLHDCFQATTASDLHYRGKKIVGSAQLRRGGAVLQHGSILLEQDQDLMGRLLAACNAGEADGTSPLRDRGKDAGRGANLFEILGRTLTMHEIEAALVSGFEETFEVEFQPGTLIDSEKRALTNVSAEKLRPLSEAF